MLVIMVGMTLFFSFSHTAVSRKKLVTPIINSLKRITASFGFSCKKWTYEDILSILCTPIRLSIRRYTVFCLYNEKSFPVWDRNKIMILSSELLSLLSIVCSDLLAG